MLQDDLTSNEKLYRAKLVANRIESSPTKVKNPFKLIDSINAKIEIIKKIPNS